MGNDRLDEVPFPTKPFMDIANRARVQKKDKITTGPANTREREILFELLSIECEGNFNRFNAMGEFSQAQAYDVLLYACLQWAKKNNLVLQRLIRSLLLRNPNEWSYRFQDRGHARILLQYMFKNYCPGLCLKFCDGFFTLAKAPGVSNADAILSEQLADFLRSISEGKWRTLDAKINYSSC